MGLDQMLKRVMINQFWLLYAAEKDAGMHTLPYYAAAKEDTKESLFAMGVTDTELFKKAE